MGAAQTQDKSATQITILAASLLRYSTRKEFSRLAITHVPRTRALSPGDFCETKARSTRGSVRPAHGQAYRRARFPDGRRGLSPTARSRDARCAPHPGRPTG